MPNTPAIKTNKPLRVKIHYGILGGERLGRRLRNELKKAGYIVTSSQDEADIIIGHSAGCFWLENTRPDQKLLLIDPPYWPARDVKDRGRARLKSNLRFRQHSYSFFRWLERDLWGFYYLLRDFRRTRRIVKHSPDFDLSQVITNHDVLLVRNEFDDWLTPDLDALKKLNPTLIIKQLPGDHDDWYHNPAPYVDLIHLLEK